jgi:hypothetical protein
MLPQMPPLKEKAVDAWHRELNDGRIEMMVKAPGFRLRVTAPTEQAWEAIEMFERWTGLAIQTDRRPRRKEPVAEGQLDMLGLYPEPEAGTTTQLETDGN